MSLNNISLSHHLLAQLYPDTLLETAGSPAQQGNVAQESSLPVHPPHESIDIVEEPAIQPPAVSGKGPATSEPVAEYGNTPSLGGNKKGILILVSHAATPYLPDAELEFLSNILDACRLSIADVAIVNLHHYPQPYTALLQQFNSRQVLLMGITPQQIDLPFHFPHFQLQNFDQRTYLAAGPLGTIAQRRDLKMQLWSCLKTMFEI